METLELAFSLLLMAATLIRIAAALMSKNEVDEIKHVAWAALYIVILMIVILMGG